MTRIDYFSNEALKADLRGKTVRGGVWTGGAQACVVIVGLAAQPALARLLDQDDFGLLAMVAVVTNFGMLLVNAGLAMATVQRDEITRQQVSNLFWIACGFGFTMGLLVACLAPGVAWFYGEPRLIAITLAMSLLFILAGATIQHQALLRRGMQYRQLATVQVLSAFLGQAAGVAWAWRHSGQSHDYWALVLVPITTALVTLLGCWIACDWRPTGYRRLAGTRALVNFGANLTGFNVLNYFARNTDKVLIGWNNGAASLGAYNQAYRLLLFPLQNVMSPLTGVMIPAMSRIANDREALTRHYLRAVRLLLATLVPALVAVAITADWWVGLVLGPKWESAAPIFRWLAIAGVIQPISNSTSWLFLSQERADAMLRFSMIAAPITVLAFVVGLPWGAVGVAAAYAILGYVFQFPFLLWWLGRNDLIDSRRLTWEIVRTLPLVALVIAANLALVACMPEATPVVGVALCVGLTCVVWGATIIATAYGREVIADFRWVSSGLKRGPRSPGKQDGAPANQTESDQ